MVLSKKNAMTDLFMKNFNVSYCGMLVFLLLLYANAQADAQANDSIRLDGTPWSEIADRNGLDPYLLYAVALTESARIQKHLASPWPWSINSRKYGVLRFETREDARLFVKKLVKEGARSADIGLMQINLYWHGHRVSDPVQLLDPLSNLEIAAAILREAIDSAPEDLTLGVGRYHSWEDGRAYWYGRKVLTILNAIRPYGRHYIH